MRRNAIFLLLSTLVFAVIVGCKAPEGGDALTGPSIAMGESYAPPIEEPAFEPETYPTYGSPAPVEGAYETVATSRPDPGPRYHTVVKSDTLYSLAREYYGDHRRWKDIYGANRSILSDPNMIRIGQRLAIP